MANVLEAIESFTETTAVRLANVEWKLSLIAPHILYFEVSHTD